VEYVLDSIIRQSLSLWDPGPLLYFPNGCWPELLARAVGVGGHDRRLSVLTLVERTSFDSLHFVREFPMERPARQQNFKIESE
jgi:hypothetical protein